MMEYMILVIDYIGAEAELNLHAADGWKVKSFNVREGHGVYRVLMEREVQ